MNQRNFWRDKGWEFSKTDVRHQTTYQKVTEPSEGKDKDNFVSQKAGNER